MWMSLADGCRGLCAGIHQPVEILVQAAASHLEPLDGVIVSGNSCGGLICPRRQEGEVDAALYQLGLSLCHAGGIG